MADAAGRARHRQRDREVGPRLVDAHAADDVHEHVGGADRDAARGGRARRARARGGCDRTRCRPAAAARAPTARRAPGPRRAAAASPPSPRARRCPGACVASPTKRALASRTSARPFARHLEDADVVRRAEAVLQRAQRPVRALALALELQHAVDEVLEHARAGERALLRDVPDEQDRGARALGDLGDPRSRPRGPGRPCPARCRARRQCSVWTESMTQASGRSARSVARTASRSVSARTGTSSAPRRRAARRAGGSAPRTPRRET